MSEAVGRFGLYHLLMCFLSNYLSSLSLGFFVVKWGHVALKTISSADGVVGVKTLTLEGFFFHQ